MCETLYIFSSIAKSVLTAVGLEAREVYTFLWWTYIGITIIFVFTEDVDDFVNPSPSTLTFPEGSLVGDTQCTNIGLVPDDVVEGTERFLIFQQISGDLLNPRVTVITIINTSK